MLTNFVTPGVTLRVTRHGATRPPQYKQISGSYMDDLRDFSKLMKTGSFVFKRLPAAKEFPWYSDTGTGTALSVQLHGKTLNSMFLAARTDLNRALPPGTPAARSLTGHLAPASHYHYL